MQNGHYLLLFQRSITLFNNLNRTLVMSDMISAMASGAIIIVECHVFTGFLMPVNLGILSNYLEFRGHLQTTIYSDVPHF